MKKLISFMHVSLDGFVATEKGEMNWIYVDQDIFDYAGRLTEQADVALYGRVTYQMMESYWPTAGEKAGATKHDIEHSLWYKHVHKIVLSKTMHGESIDNTDIVSSDLSQHITKAKEEDGKNIVIFGSPGAVHSLLSENLIDEFWLFINPVLLGSGIPMFKNIKDRTKLRLLSNKIFESGVAALHYGVER